ncbi:MAG: TlyA family RNA methyltransferase [Thermodesulfobacteriota bacterium]|nr:TlyA family RNA methyltransferase [Thermodesulfobacteriota bacterium]
MTTKKKERLDKLLVDKGFVQSRERAKALILQGKVIVDDHKIDKAGAKVFCDSSLRLKGNDIPYVSRGGLKLAHAIDEFQLQVNGSVALDVGASTGGFTDCLLQRGAKKVYAIDVGYGQLAWKLRQDPRVVSLERKNIRHLNTEEIDEEADLAVVDISFISLTKVLPKIIEFIRRRGDIAALIKPQFEVEKGKVGKGGIVHDPVKHMQVIEKIKCFASNHDLEVLGVVESPIKGADGNKEFFIHLRKTRP